MALRFARRIRAGEVDDPEDHRDRAREADEGDEATDEGDRDHRPRRAAGRRRDVVDRGGGLGRGHAQAGLDLVEMAAVGLALFPLGHVLRRTVDWARIFLARRFVVVLFALHGQRRKGLHAPPVRLLHHRRRQFIHVRIGHQSTSSMV